MIWVEIILLAAVGAAGIMEPIKKKWWKELVVYIVIFLLGSVLLMLQTAGIKLPYLIDEVSKFFKIVLHLSYD